LTTDHFSFLVDRQDITQAALQSIVPPDLVPGEARLEIESLALSANTLTYAATGGLLGYWKFFPVSGSAGLVPAWGIARVAQSRCELLPEGSRWFGFLPLASHFVVTPRMRGEARFTDAAPHRQELPANYNIYRNVDHDPFLLPGREEECALLRPLVILSFLIVEHLKARGVSAADQVMLTSASSKVALAVAHLARQAGCGYWLGLTSEKHSEFVRATGAYDRVATYQDIEWLDAAPGILLDVSGNESVRTRIETRWAHSIKEALIVGATQWDAAQASFSRDARTSVFFAPDVMKASLAAGGPDVFEARFLEAWRSVLDWTPQWLTLERRTGAAGLASTYRDLLQGAVPPDRGLYVALSQ
jgi:hypothetical protein